MKNKTNTAASKPGNQQSGAPAIPQYGIFQSLNHMMGALKRNPVTFGVTLVVSYVLSGIALFLTIFAATGLLLGKFGLLFASLSKILIVLVASLIIYTLLYALVYAFTVSCIAFSLSPDKFGIGTVLKKALQSTIRLVKVNAWVAIVAYWPITIAASLPLLMLSGSRLGNPSAALFAPVLVIAALIWALIAQLRYALAPYIALFEPDVPVKQTLKRSDQLLKHGGQLFIFKGVLLVLAIFIFLATVVGSNLKQLEHSNDMSINIIFIVVSILMEGVMVMLYFNRAGKQDVANTPKSPKLLVVVIAVLVGLLGFSAYGGKNNAGGGTLSKTNQEALKQIVNDLDRKTEIKAIAEALEGYYNEHGYYPAVIDVSNTEWGTNNLKQKVGNTTITLVRTRLSDPKSNYINSQYSDYQYKASPENCTQCASFELTAKLEEGGEYKQSSLNNTIKPAASTAPTKAPTTSTTTSNR